MFRAGWGDPAQAAGRAPVTQEALEPGHGEFRDIPYLSWQKEGQTIEEAGKGEGQIPAKEQTGEGLSEVGREDRG